MTNIPTISAILSNYNYARSLQKSIKSILEQTYNDFDIIIFDDGLTHRWRPITTDFGFAVTRACMPCP